jgi:hypothetical protein
VRKVAAMRHRRDVLDVLSLINQSTVDLNIFDTSAGTLADPKWSRSTTRSRGGSAFRTGFGLLHRRMSRHQRDASSLPSRAKTLTGGR